MIARLVKRHLLFPTALPFSLMGAVILAAAPPTLGVLIALPFILPVAPMLLQRPSVFEAALPMRGRDIYASRLIAALLLIWFPVFVAIGAELIRGTRDGPFTMWLGIGGVATLVCIIPYSINSSQIRQPPIPQLAAAVILLAGLLALSVRSLPTETTVVIVFLAIAALLFKTIRTTQASYQTAPISATAPGRLSAVVVSKAIRLRAPAWWWWPAFRSVIRPMLVFSFGMMIMTGVTGKVVIYILLFGATVIDGTRQRTKWLAALPVSYRARLLIPLIPVLIAMPGGLFIGYHIPFSRRFLPDYIEHGSPYLPGTHSQFPSNKTNIGLEYWERSQRTAIPVITAPWGERYLADTVSVLGVVFYNPYSTGAASSAQFREWQFGRATTAIYGAPMTLAQYERDPLPLRHRITNSARMQILDAAALLMLVLGIAYVYELTLWGGFARWRRGLAVAMALRFVPTFGLMSFDMYQEFFRGTLIVAPLTQWLLLRLSPSLPHNIVAVAIIAMLPVVALYFLIEWQFARSELSRDMRMTV
ncbi:MAG: hypothetical protein V4550_11920 [Gemmatimonadota bacterium]